MSNEFGNDLQGHVGGFHAVAKVHQPTHFYRQFAKLVGHACVDF